MSQFGKSGKQTPFSPTIKPNYVPGILELIVMNENLQPVVYDSFSDLARWNMVFHQLPPGVNIVMLKGTRASHGLSGFAVDDITIASCASVGKSDIVYCNNKKEIGANITHGHDPCVRSTHLYKVFLHTNLHY